MTATSAVFTYSYGLKQLTMKLSSNKTLTTTWALSAFFVAGVFAQTPAAHESMDHSKMGGEQLARPPVKADARVMTEGVVEKIDVQAQTITLKHGPIKNLDMAAMTMVFKTKSPALLNKVKTGDKVKFRAEMPNGSLTVTAIERVR